MRSAARLVAAALVALSACATGQENGGVDATAVDAPATDAPATDGPVIDGPSIDGPSIDGPAIDGPAIDGPAIDGPAIDGPAIDAPIDGPAIDAPIDGPAIDAPVDGGPLGNGDTCATAIDITNAALMPGGTTIPGNLTGFADSIQPLSSCTGFYNDGPDAIYLLDLASAGMSITATVDAPTWDSAIEIVQPCTYQPTCLAGQDNGNPESVTITTAAPGQFYVVVDSWDPGSYGPYTLTVVVQ